MTTRRTTLHAASTCPAQARAFVTHALRAWDAPSLIPTATLLTSELVTNAFLHGLPGIDLSLERTAEGFRFEISDHSSQQPVLRTGTIDDTCGRGLHIVEQLAAAWGVAPIGPAGKTVWFELEPT